LNENKVQFVSKECNADGPVLPGSGGQDVLGFEAMNVGKAHITLLYYPPSNDPVIPQQKVKFTVTVK